MPAAVSQKITHNAYMSLNVHTQCCDDGASAERSSSHRGARSRTSAARVARAALVPGKALDGCAQNHNIPAGEQREKKTFWSHKKKYTKYTNYAKYIKT